jgi:hypothetical protein
MVWSPTRGTVSKGLAGGSTEAKCDWTVECSLKSTMKNVAINTATMHFLIFRKDKEKE